MMTALTGATTAPRVADLLSLAATGSGITIGPAQHVRPVRLYGGLSVAQAVVAGFGALPETWQPGSVKVTFGRPGEGSAPVQYLTRQLTHGRTRYVAEVVAHQSSQPLLWATLSGQQAQPDGLEFDQAREPAPPPEECPNGIDRLRGPDATGLNFLFAQRWQDLDIRRVPETAGESGTRWWMRVRSPLSEPVHHAAAVAYLTDFVILDAALRPHDLSFADPAVFSVSLDFAIWWHRAVDANAWLMVETEPVISIGARSLARATVANRAGRHVATIVQEGRLTYSNGNQPIERV